tara:strand:+ start:2713 stop:3099 length:387 start_codon:yes stop_codon:yes gene_type:complete
MSKIKVEVLGKKAPRPNRRAQKVSKRITTAQSERNLTRKVVSFVWFVVKPRRPTWALGALAFVLASFGTPHLLLSHDCTGTGAGSRCYECRYGGFQGVWSHMGPNWNCPAVAMIPVNWGVLARQVGIR